CTKFEDVLSAVVEAIVDEKAVIVNVLPTVVEATANKKASIVDVLLAAVKATTDKKASVVDVLPIVVEATANKKASTMDMHPDRLKRASGWSEDDAVGNSLGVHQELAEGIGSLLGWRKGVYRKKTETHRKIVGVAKRLAGSWEEPPIPCFHGAFDGCIVGVGRLIAHTRIFRIRLNFGSKF
ncbi:hypothetical protein B296_00046202, partial [Ensete ventricosum]